MEGYILEKNVPEKVIGKFISKVVNRGKPSVNASLCAFAPSFVGATYISMHLYAL